MKREEAKRLCESVGAEVRDPRVQLWVASLTAQVVPSVDAIDGTLRVIMVGCAGPCDFREARDKATAAGVGYFDLEGPPSRLVPC